MSDDAPVPPQNLDAEESVLGAAMISQSAIDRVLDEHLAAGDFYRHTHGMIWEAILALYIENEPVDPITVADKLDKNGTLAKAGGVEKIHELATLVPATANVAHYARIVRDMAVLRALILAGHEITTLGWERGAETRDLLDRAEGLVFDLAQARPSQDFVSIRETSQQSFDRISDAYENGVSTLTGLPTGFTHLDDILSGLQRGNLIVIAGRPSMGKTAFALSISANIAFRSSVPVVIFTMEMSRAEITDRIISSEAQVESTTVRNGRLNPDEWGRLVAAMGRIQEAPIIIDDSAMLTAMELRSKARKAKLRYPNLGLVVVDYLQLMTSGSKTDSRVQDVSQISRTMKVLARELNVPVIALSQLSRQVEQRHDKRPVLSDLRESGAIEQDADVVAFVYRDEYYNPEDTDQAGMAEVIIAKHRNGATGMTKLAFVKRYVRFAEIPSGVSER